MIFLALGKGIQFFIIYSFTAYHALKQMMHVISWLYGRMRRGLLGWECQGQPVIYGEDSWHHLGLSLFHRHHFRHFSACNLCRERPSRSHAFLLQYCCRFPHHICAFKSYQPLIIVIYWKESWHQIGLLKSSWLSFTSQNRQFLDAQIYLL